ncbi:MAG: hypothetical protein J0H48_11640 [Nitrosospira multiformis]|nr:hypothetical protein [Nitrosospira multiformis]
MAQFTDQFAVANWVIVPTGPTPGQPEDQKWHLVLSGIAFFTFQGTSTGDWRRDSLRMAIDLKPAMQFTGRSAAPGKELRFQVEQWAPYSALNSIFDANQSVNAGFAADSFRMIFATRGAFSQIFESFEVDLAVRDSDAFIFRVGYHLTLIGTIVETQPLVRVPDVRNSGRTFQAVCNTATARLQAVSLRAHCSASVNQPVAPSSPPPPPPPPNPFFVESQNPVAGAEVPSNTLVEVVIASDFL